MMIYSIYFFVIGLIVGSFLNVMALRLLSGEDFVFERSKCPNCKAKIAWYDNIPILSYILLRAKCRQCGKGISIQYPIVELLTGLLFLFIYLNWGLSLKSVFLFVLTSLLIVITITDLKEEVIFDITSIPLIPLGLLYNFLNLGGENMLIPAIIGAIIGAAFFEIFSRIGMATVGQYAFGGGDTILGAALGAWFGWKFLIAILAMSVFFQAIYGIPIIFYNMYKRKDYASLWAMAGLLFAMVVSFFSKYLTYLGEPLVAIFVILMTFLLAGICVYIIFKKMRETQNHTMLPFGPPLVAAGFIVMFFGDYVSRYIPF
ncbi:MAG: hypothetical protein A2Y25_04920 [Candidatus Melainabacteria bacterium GWF2_37_15]|nr:MAG: hypothetical protein A2Y25_04920 [Candidatus Melainabacteria bacterium GWF2_37_15]